MPAVPSLTIEVAFDLICPWCLIGKRHLATAIAQLRAEQPDVAITVEWRSLPLIPDTPLAGIPYREFYLARLGSAAAVAARQAQVQAAAREAGLSLALTQIETFPNTLLAHRLVRFAREEVGTHAASALIETLFTRYFMRAEDIGQPRVLREALRECGIPIPMPADAPLHHDLPWLPHLPARAAPASGNGMGVPHFDFNGALGISGAVPPATLLQSMRRALALSQ